MRLSIDRPVAVVIEAAVPDDALARSDCPLIKPREEDARGALRRGVVEELPVPTLPLWLPVGVFVVGVNLRDELDRDPPPFALPQNLPPATHPVAVLAVFGGNTRLFCDRLKRWRSCIVAGRDTAGSTPEASPSPGRGLQPKQRPLSTLP
jgi:hypothetical protein